MIFSSFLTLFLSAVSLVDATNPRLLASRAQTPGVVASGPVSSACIGVIPGTGSDAGVSYYDGTLGGCPFKNKLDADGSCASYMTTAVGLCSAYCEVRNFFMWGQEIPTGVTCQSGDPTCGISESTSFAVTQTYSFNIGGSVGTKRSENSSWLLAREETTADILEATFNLGATYQYSSTTTTSITGTQGRPTPLLSYCGYFTSVPAFMTSCGSLTTAQVTDQLPSNEAAPPNIPRRQENVQCDISTQTTTPNWCNTSPVRDSNGNHYTVTIFVPTNCGNASTGTDNAGPLPSSYQNAIYVQPGVAARPVPAG